MTSMEDRLRRALAEGTEHVQWTGATTVPAKRRLLPPLLAPVAVAAAVAIIVVLGVGVIRSRTPGPSGATMDGVPRHLVTTDDGGLSVIDASSGKVTAHVPPAPGVQAWGTVSSTTDEHVFYLAATLGPPLPRLGSHPVPDASNLATELFRLRIDSAGKHPRLTPVLRIPEGTQIDSSAVSPDGTRLAVASENGPDGSLQIDVTTLSTGHRQIFSASGNQPGGDIQWLADGRQLAFSITGMRSASAAHTGLWVLNTDSPDGDLLGSARRVVPVAGSRCGIPSFMLSYDLPSGDGSKVYMVSKPGAALQITVCDLKTGGPPRVFAPHVAAAAWKVLPGDGAGPKRILPIVSFRPFVGNHLLFVSGNRAYLIDAATGRAATVSFAHPPLSVAW